MKIDWKTGFMPSMRTAGALMVGNSGVLYLIGTTSTKAVMAMLIMGLIIVVTMSLTFPTKGD